MFVVTAPRTGESASRRKSPSTRAGGDRLQARPAGTHWSDMIRPGMFATKGALLELTAATGAALVTVPAVKFPVPLEVTKLFVARS